MRKALPFCLLFLINCFTSYSQCTPGNISTNPTTTCGGNDGAIFLPDINGTLTYSVTYDRNGVTRAATFLVNGSGMTITNLAAGTYTNIQIIYNSGACSAGISGPFTVNSPAAPTISISPAIATVCPGQPVTLSASGASTYTWSPGTGLNTTSGASVTATPATSTTYTVTGAASNNCTNTATKTVKVNNPAAAIAGTATVCRNATSPGISFTGSNGTAPYTFTYKINGGAEINVTSTGNIATIAAPTNAVGDFVYSLVSVSDAISCANTASGSATITVNATPTINAVGSQTVCAGSATSAITFTGSVSGTSYNWTNSNTAIGLATSGSGNIASFTAINTSDAAITSTVTVTPVLITNGVTCTGTPTTLTITVSPRPTVAAIANQTACAGNATGPVNFSGNVSGTVFNWTNNNSAIGLAGSGTGNIASFTAANTTSSAVMSTVTVTPVANGCTGTPVTFTITVNPQATVATVSNQTVCNGSTTAAIAFSGPLTGTTYSWINTTPSIGLLTSGTGNIAAFAATNTSSVPVTATITVTPTANGCPGTATSFTITVNPSTVITTQPAPQTICPGATASFSVAATAAGPLTYQWRKGGIAIAGATSSTYAVVNAMNADAASYDVVVTGSCGAATSSPAALVLQTGCTTAVPDITADVQTAVLMPNVIKSQTTLRVVVLRSLFITWTLTDAQGRQVIRFTSRAMPGQNNDMTLSLQQLSSGLYYLNGESERGRVATLQVVKE